MSDQTTTPPTPEKLREARELYDSRLRDEVGTPMLQAELAKLRRDTAQWNQEELEFKFQVHSRTGQIRKMALEHNLVTEEELGASDQQPT